MYSDLTEINKDWGHFGFGKMTSESNVKYRLAGFLKKVYFQKSGQKNHEYPMISCANDCFFVL